jgi:O-antigen/teichoic acid export membrane protein
MKMSWLKGKLAVVLNSSLIRNSGWGLLSNVIQVTFVCIFFSIVARKFPTDEFAKFLIATTVYQIVASFSSMGLGQWFIRQYVIESGKLDITSKYLKTQSFLGIVFYVINIALAYILYPDPQIRILCIVLGVNIIFDNLITAIKSLNIAEYQQSKTAPILMIDGFLRLVVGLVLLCIPFSVTTMALLLITVRILTVGLFIKIGTSNSVTLSQLWIAKISTENLKVLILKNWQFMVIGSISIIYWRMGNIIISKMLTLVNVAEYEIAFRIFSLLQIVPLVVSASVYPQLIRYFNEKNYSELKYFYHNVFIMATIFSVLCYAFTFSFSGIIIPLVFGKGYPGSVLCLQQMSLSLLLIPTVLLQANLIVAIKLEKLDMWFNISSLLVYAVLCIVGLHFYRSLTVINYAIMISFIVFHLCQDFILVKKNLSSVLSIGLFYGCLAVLVVLYQSSSKYLNPFLNFSLLIILMIIILVFVMIIRKRNHLGKTSFNVIS